MRALALLVCLLAVASADDIKDSIEGSNGRRKLHESKYSPGYVAATMADAWADLFRAKAQAKYNKAAQPTEILPTPLINPVPSKSKTFAYTNIRLSSDTTGAPTPTPPGDLLPDTVATRSNPFITQDVPVSGARTESVPVASGTRPLVAQPVTVPPLTTGTAAGAAVATAQTSDVDAKLAELQAQLKQLQDLENQIKAMKAAAAASATAPKRKLLDAGMPGWDAGVLLQKKLEILSRQAELLQDKISFETGDLQSKLMGKSANNANKLASVADFASDRMYGKMEAREAMLDAWKEHALTNAGNLQDMLSSLMDARARAFEDKWGV